MTSSTFISQIKSNFPYQPTLGQEKAMSALYDFLFEASADSLFVLCGYAGTGKTSLVGALVKTLSTLGMETVLLAPTGRAAKVFSRYAGVHAYTIHKKIYVTRYGQDNEPVYRPDRNRHRQTLFLVDEASMISNRGGNNNLPGAGHLLDDLVDYVYNNRAGCKLLLMGDAAQLPPVGEAHSPALDEDLARHYGLQGFNLSLAEVVRQEMQSGILWNATRLRLMLQQGQTGILPKVRIKGFADIRVVEPGEFADLMTECYDTDGVDETVVVCRSNKRALAYNNGIRYRVLYREEALECGDLLMVAKNNYYWAKDYPEVEFIANGDLAEVRHVGKNYTYAGFQFLDVSLKLSSTGTTVDVRIIQDTLHAETAALSTADQQKIYLQALQDVASLPTKTERKKALREHPFLNAVHVKYGYAITCHKAQGGQWKNVWFDQPYVDPSALDEEYLRWLYTAFTRASGTLYLLGYPQDRLE